MFKSNKNNLIIFYTGNGKGKTTAALGLVARALRDKMKVILIQFIKSEQGTGEISLTKVLCGLKVKNFGTGLVVKKPSQQDIKKLIQITQSGVEFSEHTIESQKFKVIILDEIFVAYNLRLLSLKAMISLIKSFRKTQGQHFLVLTGRGCPTSLYKYADLVTEMKEIKHPFQKGIMAIKGIDY